MTRGVIYVLTNPAMDGYVKIGKTTNLEQRLRTLDNTSMPLPFRCVFAVEVDDMDSVEKLVHEAFKKDRVRSNREFFEIFEEQAIATLKISGGKDVTPKSDIGEDDEAVAALNDATQKRSRFKFSYVGLKVGDELEYLRDPSVKARVVDDTSIQLGGRVTSLSAATHDLLVKEGINWKTVQGPRYWTSNGEILSELRKKIEQQGE